MKSAWNDSRLLGFSNPREIFLCYVVECYDVECSILGKYIVQIYLQLGGYSYVICMVNRNAVIMHLI